MDHFSEADLQQYLLGEIVEETQARLEQHLETCVSCQRSLEALADDGLVRDYYEATRRVAPPDDRPEPLCPPCHPADAPRKVWQIPSEPDSLPAQFNRFVLQEFLGSGGFGVVYLAEDLDLQRQVAVKIPHLGNLSPDVRPRFLREGTAAANLHHPHIVQVHQAGEHDGICFLVSEYCPGSTLRHSLSARGRPYPAEEVVRIVLPLVEAVDHAHQNGVVHRDIKPANVILDDRVHENGLPFTPKLTDFGAARLFGANCKSNTVTASGMLVGTPSYTAPEQVSGSDEAGPSCDIYSLGVLLYELIAGSPPIQGTNGSDTLQRVLTVDPVPLHRVVNGIPQDLSAICSKCLEKTPRSRYDSAAALAEDLRRFLNHEPTLARPLGLLRRFGRWARRNPSTLGIAGSLVLGSCLITLGFAWHNQRLNETNRLLAEAHRRSRQAAKRATLSEWHTRGLLYASDMNQAEKAWRDGDTRTVWEVLRRHVPAQNQSDLRGIEWFFVRRAACPPAGIIARLNAPLYCLRLSPDQQSFAFSGQDAVIRICDRVTGEVLQAISSHQREVNDVTFSPDGRRLASAGDDGTIRVWRLSDGAQLQSIAAHDGLAFGVSFTPDGRRIISCGTDRRVQIWDSGSGRRLNEYHDHTGEVEALAVAPDGSRFATVGDDRKLVVRELSTGELHLKWEDAHGALSSVAFSPDARRVAVGEAAGETRALKFFDVDSKSLILTCEHPDGIRCIDYSPDGSSVVTLDNVGTARIWDIRMKEGESTRKGALVDSWQAHEGKVYSAKFEPTGQSLLTAGKDGQVRRWTSTHLEHEHIYDLAGLTEVFDSPHAIVFSIGFHANNTELIAAVGHGVVRLKLNRTATPEVLVRAGYGWVDVASDHGRGWFVAALGTGPEVASDGVHQPARIERWGDSDRRPRNLLTTTNNCSLNHLAISHDSRYLAFMLHDHSNGKDNKEVWILEADSGTPLHKFPASSGSRPQFTPDNRFVVFGSQRHVKLMDLHGEQHRTLTNAHEESINGTAVSRDGKWLATCDGTRVIRIWQLPTFRFHAELNGHRGKITAMEFSRDSRTLLSSSSDGSVKAWSVGFGQRLMNIHLGQQRVNHMALASDSSRLAVVEDARRIRVYDLR